MKPAKQYALLESHAIRQIQRLRLVAELVTPATDFRTADRIAAFISIEALNVWTNFARAYVLSTPLRPYTLSGSRVTHSTSGLSKPRAALVLLVSHFSRKKVNPGNRIPRRDEPSWHDPAVIRTTCKLLGSTNAATVDSALSLRVRVIADLPTFRNFYAHRNSDTAQKAIRLARRYSLPLPNHPSHIPIAFALGRPQRIMLDWLDELRTVIRAICA